MPKKLLRHIVRQGESLESIAALHGLSSAERILALPENRELARQRVSTILEPGDIVTIPDGAAPSFPCAEGGSYRFKATMPRTRLALTVQIQGQALRNAAFELRFGARKIEGTTDADGKLDVAVPPNVHRAALVFPKEKEAFDLHIGHLDPIETDSGVGGRLRNLGYGGSPASSADELSAALYRFRKDHGLSLEAEGIDDELREALRGAHGS